MRRNLLTSWSAGAAITVTAMAGLGVPVAGAQEAPPGYIALASAQGMRSTYSLPGQVVVEEVYDFGGPVAQSRLDVSGGSGFASLPFPGAAGVVGAGLVLNLAGLSDSVPTPEYPFYAGAQYPSTPKTEVGQPGSNYALTAQAESKSSSSAAQFRGGPKEGFVGSSLARTDVKESGGSVVATGESVNKGVSIGDGALTIGSVLSQAAATLSPDGAITSTSKLLVDGLEVGGEPAGLSPEGLDESALNSALAPMGLSARIVHGGSTPNGVNADALEIRFVHPIPEGGGNEGTVVYRFGGASATIVTGSDPAEDVDVAAAEPRGPAPASAPGAEAAPPRVPAVVTPASPQPEPRPAAEPAVNAEPAPAPSELAERLHFTPVAAVSTPDSTAPSDEWTTSYGVLIVGAGVLLVSVLTLLRRRGTSWNIS